MSIKTCKANHTVVKRLTSLYNFAYDSVIAKIAINYSLQLNKTFELEDYKNWDNNGMEYQDHTLFGGRENYFLYRALLNQQYGKILSEEEFNKLTKIHLDWALDKLRVEVLEADRGRNAVGCIPSGPLCFLRCPRRTPVSKSGIDRQPPRSG